MADNAQWFKLWCSADDDPDLGNLSNEDFGRWCKLGMYLKKHGSMGRVEIRKPATILQSKFRLDSYAELLDALLRFPNIKVEEFEKPIPKTITNTVTINVTVTIPTLIITFSNWRKYQVDSSRERMQKLRRKKEVGDDKCDGIRREEKRREEKRNTLPLPPLKTEFISNQSWLSKFLLTQTLVNLPPAHLQALQNPDFWERTATAMCGGLDLAFLEREFAKMGIWLSDNPSRRPTPRGFRRFVSSWLIRGYEEQRGNATNQQNHQLTLRSQGLQSSHRKIGDSTKDFARAINQAKATGGLIVTDD